MHQNIQRGQIPLQTYLGPELTCAWTRSVFGTTRALGSRGPTGSMGKLFSVDLGLGLVQALGPISAGCILPDDEFFEIQRKK